VSRLRSRRARRSPCRRALGARLRPRGERLGGDHGERRQHPRGVGVAARLDRREDRGRDLLWHLGLLQREHEHGGEVLQLGGIVERRRVVEHGDERRNDLLVQNLALGFADVGWHGASVDARPADSYPTLRGATAERRPAMIYPSGSGGSPTRPTAHRAT